MRERERERHERLRYPRSVRGILEAGAKRFRDYEGDASVHLVQKAQRLRVHLVHDETLPQAGLRGRPVSFETMSFFFFLQEQVYKGAYTRRKIIFSSKSFDQCCLIIFHFEIKFPIELLFSRRIRNTLFILRDIMREKLVEEEIRRTCCEH